MINHTHIEVSECSFTLLLTLILSPKRATIILFLSDVHKKNQDKTVVSPWFFTSIMPFRADGFLTSVSFHNLCRQATAVFQCRHFDQDALRLSRNSHAVGIVVCYGRNATVIIANLLNASRIAYFF